MPVLSPRSVLARVRSWSREHALAMDMVWAVLWFVPSVLTWPFSTSSVIDTLFHTCLAVACCAALGVRRVLPLTSLAVLAVLLLGQVLWLGWFTPLAVICVSIATYTSQAELSPWWRHAILTFVLLCTAWAVLWVPGAVSSSEDLGVRVTSVLSGWTFVLLFAALGTVRRHNREEVGRLMEHTRLLEERRAQELRLAALDERTHIAREMHDVLAHSLNVIVAQADGGRYVARTDPKRAVAALETIGRVGRESSRELHQLLGILRDDEQRETSPALGIDDLPTLVEEYREAGLRVRMVLEEGPPERGEAEEPPPTSVSLTIYRLVQESLANTLKHAGPTTVRVDLVRSPGRIVLTVINPLDSRPTEIDERDTGHGLTGMRERVALHGGTLEVGKDETTATWRVRAVVPWEEA